jgi:hypothetical protein
MSRSFKSKVVSLPTMPPMNTHVRGTFDVKASHEPPYDTRPGAILGRSSFEKAFQGPLTATSRVDMLAALTAVSGSAAYVALERVSGTLEGRTGSFVLQHAATMERGASMLAVTVVPDSATGDLAGLRGAMTIENLAGQHRYDFEFWFAAPPG